MLYAQIRTHERFRIFPADPSHGNFEQRRLRLVSIRVLAFPIIAQLSSRQGRLQHEPVGRSAGLTVAQLREIRLAHAFASEHTPKSSLTPELKAAMLFADFMTKSVQVPQPIFDKLHQFLDDKQMVDAVATVGTYNLVARFVEALDIDSKADVPVPIPQ